MSRNIYFLTKEGNIASQPYTWIPISEIDEALASEGTKVNVVEITDADSPYSALLTDNVIMADSTAGNVDVELPDSGSEYIPYTIISKGTGGNDVNITTPGGVVTIDGVTTYTLADGESLSVVFDGTNYIATSRDISGGASVEAGTTGGSILIWDTTGTKWVEDTDVVMGNTTVTTTKVSGGNTVIDMIDATVPQTSKSATNGTETSQIDVLDTSVTIQSTDGVNTTSITVDEAVPRTVVSTVDGTNTSTLDTANDYVTASTTDGTNTYSMYVSNNTSQAGIGYTDGTVITSSVITSGSYLTSSTDGVTNTSQIDVTNSFIYQDSTDGTDTYSVQFGPGYTATAIVYSDNAGNEAASVQCAKTSTSLIFNVTSSASTSIETVMDGVNSVMSITGGNNNSQFTLDQIGLNISNASGSGVINVLPNTTILEVDTSGGVATVNLPQSIGLGAVIGKGHIIIVSDVNGNAAANNITIDGDGAETINGAATLTLNSNYGVARLYCLGGTWVTI